MSRITIAPIVEGHGDRGAIRILLQRVWTEVLGGEYAEILQPIRHPRTKLVQQDGLTRAVQLAALKLQHHRAPTNRLILILIDSNHDCPAQEGPRLERLGVSVRSDMDVACVIAKMEYETWFVAAADSLSEFLHIDPPGEIPDDPEGARCGKRWIQQRFKMGKYSETVDQPRMTARMNLLTCRDRSPSFAALCRKVGRRLSGAS